MCFRQKGLGKQAARNVDFIPSSSMILKHGGVIAHPPSHVNHRLDVVSNIDTALRASGCTWMLQKFCNVGEQGPRRAPYRPPDFSQNPKMGQIAE